MKENVIYQKNDVSEASPANVDNSGVGPGANGISYIPADTTLSPDFDDLLSFYLQVLSYDQKEIISPIYVDELASKFALLYEKLRIIIDWKEEHLIRRTAIDRALKRRMISKLSGISLTSGIEGKKLALPLIMELIRGGHFPNGRIPKSVIPQIEKVLKKYIYILSYSEVQKKLSPLAVAVKVQFYNWVLEFASCEIEEVLDPPLKEAALINFMTRLMNSRIHIFPHDAISDEDKLVQIHIAVHRTLFNLDAPIITYALLKHRYPGWTKHDPDVVKDFSENAIEVWGVINDELSHKLSPEFFKVCEKYDAAYLILGDVLKKLLETPEKIAEKVGDRKKFRGVITEVYEKRFSTLSSRLRRSAIYSTLSVFLAGGLSLFIFEVPLARYFYGEFSSTAIAVDIAIPCILMFILVLVIRPAGKGNFERVVEEIEKIVYKTDREDVYDMLVNQKQKLVKNIIFGLFYLIGGTASFAFTFWIFYIANVPWTSLYVDTANVAVIVFAALVIRQRSKEITIEEKATFGDFLIDVFSIPMGKLGQWLANKWKEYNVLSVFFTIIVDIPILAIVEIIEDWRTFIKDQKAGIH
ncbi:MAG: hypothetical protein U9Q67_01895 [Patescibacteria group bacterium]|nr:hypothetical protein [Patescibacteria group bacterium]